MGESCDLIEHLFSPDAVDTRWCGCVVIGIHHAGEVRWIGDSCGYAESFGSGISSGRGLRTSFTKSRELAPKVR
jgi:hypothetical protein